MFIIIILYSKKQLSNPCRNIIKSKPLLCLKSIELENTRTHMHGLFLAQIDRLKYVISWLINPTICITGAKHVGRLRTDQTNEYRLIRVTSYLSFYVKLSIITWNTLIRKKTCMRIISWFFLWFDENIYRSSDATQKPTRMHAGWIFQDCYTIRMRTLFPEFCKPLSHISFTFD